MGQGGYFEHKQRFERNTNEAIGIVRVIVGLISLVIVLVGRLGEPLCCYRMGAMHLGYHAVVAAIVFVVGTALYVSYEPVAPSAWPVIYLLTAYVLHVGVVLFESFIRMCVPRTARVHSWDLGRPWPWFEGVGWVMGKIPVARVFVPPRMVFIGLLFPLGFAGIHTILWWRTGLEAWWMQGAIVGGAYLLWQLTLLQQMAKHNRQRRDQEIMASNMQGRSGW